ncbi:hypothetical protein [Vibrio harveyi]
MKLDFFCYMLACRVKMSRQAERTLPMTLYLNSARQLAQIKLQHGNTSRVCLMKINTPHEHHLAFLRIEQLFNVDDPKSTEGKT